jgi:mono/diheme cytochrome c family protein
MMGFSAKEHISQLKGKDYLEVKWRIVWFREDHPNGSIVTDLVNVTPPVVKATISDEQGRIIATGLASAKLPANGTAVWAGREIEKAETAAIGRALAHAGYGTQFAGEDVEEGDNLADSPVDQRRNQPAKPKGTPEPANGTTRATLSPDKLVNTLKTKAANIEVEVQKADNGTIMYISTKDAQALARDMESIMLTKTRKWILSQAFDTETCTELNHRQAAAVSAWLKDKAAARLDAEGVKAFLERTNAPDDAAAEFANI